jgi:glycerol-3-phosphate dehydrogenase (NAD(P)+)
VAEALPEALPAILSGPTFAIEVARGLPSAITLACRDRAVGEALVTALGRPTFRPYLSDDLTGAQVGGAVKNVIAIACGIVSGARLGDNARAALIARGLAEVVRLGAALGGRAETLFGLSGLGDLTLTCTSATSRNMSLGIALGEGRALTDVLDERTSVAEGVFTASAVRALAEKMGVDMPICFAVDRIINEGAALESIVEGLLSRPFKPESLSADAAKIFN